MQKEKLLDFVLFNFLAKNKSNAEEIMEAGKGYIIPGIVASDFEDISLGVDKVNELKRVTNTISVGLGGGGDPQYAKRVVEIAARSNPGHINQPFERAAYAKGYLEGKEESQLVNGLVVPSGKVGTVCLPSGQEMAVEELVGLAKQLGIESIKFMPLKGEQHLAELVYLTQVAAQKGIRGIEPAGGIGRANIKMIIEAVQHIDIEFFMPHIFGSTIDPDTKRTIPSEVETIIQHVEELA